MGAEHPTFPPNTRRMLPSRSHHWATGNAALPSAPHTGVPTTWSQLKSKLHFLQVRGTLENVMPSIWSLQANRYSCIYYWSCYLTRFTERLMFLSNWWTLAHSSNLSSSKTSASAHGNSWSASQRQQCWVWQHLGCSAEPHSQRCPCTSARDPSSSLGLLTGLDFIHRSCYLLFQQESRRWWANAAALGTPTQRWLPTLLQTPPWFPTTSTTC